MPSRREDHPHGRPVEDARVLGDLGPDVGAELLQSREPWSHALPPRLRKAVAAATVLVLLLGAGATAVARTRAWLDEQDRRRDVSLGVALGAWTSSSSPPGGSVTYFLTVRNAGAYPLEVIALHGSGELLRLRSRGAVVRQLEAGGEILVPLSALLTCSATSAAGGNELDVEVDVRRADGSTATSRLPLDGTLVLDAARTLCGVRPALREHELSGPVLATDPRVREP